MNSLHPERKQETALLWFVKVLAGGLIFVFLVIHFFVNHLLVPGGLLTFTDVVAYYQNPAILVMEGLFVSFILVHGLLGFRSVILDLNPSGKFMKTFDLLLIFGGSATLIYAIWLLITVSALGRV